MNSLKKVIMLMLTLISPFFFSSCFDYREANELAIVTGMAIDKSDDKNKLKLTIEYIKITSSEHGLKPGTEIIESEGITMFDAARNAIGKTGKKLYWGHAKTVIISKPVAEGGVVQIVDWITRDSEMRSEMFFMVSNESTAKELLVKNKSDTEMKAFTLSDIITNQKNLSKAEYNKDIVMFSQYLARKEVTLTLPIVYLDHSCENRSQMISGTAIFKGDKLFAEINGDESKTMLLIRNSLKGGLIVLENINDTETNVSLEIFENKTKIKASYDGGKVTLKINISPTVDIGELSKDVDFIELKRQQELKAFAENKIEKDVKNLVEKVQKNNYGDIFDFAKHIKMQMPSVWRAIESDWENVFNSINVVVNVDVNIKGSARSSKAVNLGE